MTNFIVGSGLCGSWIARCLKDRGEQVVVFEKSKGVGGRVAHRRIGGDGAPKSISVHHGVDQFEVITEKAQRFFRGLAAEGYLEPDPFRWLPPATRYFKDLLSDIEVRRESKIELIDPLNPNHHGRWFVTAPVPQAIEISKGLLTDSELQFLQGVKYSKRILWTRETVAPHLGAMDDSFSEAFFELEDLEIAQKISEATGLNSTEIQVKKWRYEKPISQLAIPFFYKKVTNHLELYLVGDGFAGVTGINGLPGLEAAWCSADAVLNSI